jgi:hypothetical protein
MAGKKPTKHGNCFKDLTNKQFGFLRVIRWDSARNKKTRWLCECRCGARLVVLASSLNRGCTLSCGCYHAQRTGESHKTHGLAGTKEYRAWQMAKGRCFNPNNNRFKSYRARGISMCQRWRDSFAAFIADMGPCPEGLTLDRIDNNGDYEPKNCRWADRSTQGRNTQKAIMITHDGLTLHLKEWAIRLDIPYNTLHLRHRRGWPLFAPLRHNSPRYKGRR